MKKIVIFASGSGSNAEKIIKHFDKKSNVNVIEIITNNPNAKVLEIAKKYLIPTKIISKQDLEQQQLVDYLLNLQLNLIVLAGFLLKIPKLMVQNFPNKIINIHPALLPKYGGKGMYGMNIHNAILENKESQTGITIHYINENYDEGTYIFQKAIPIENCKTAEEIAKKVLQLEHLYFSQVIEEIIYKNE